MNDSEIAPPSLARSNSTMSSSSSVYSENDTSVSSSCDNADVSFASSTSPSPTQHKLVEEQTKQRQELIIATSDYYDYALKLERLNIDLNKTKRDHDFLQRQLKRKQKISILEMGPEQSRLIGHTPDTLASKMQFTEEEIRRVKMHMKRIQKAHPQVVTDPAGPAFKY